MKLVNTLASKRGIQQEFWKPDAEPGGRTAFCRSVKRPPDQVRFRIDFGVRPWFE